MWSTSYNSYNYQVGEDPHNHFITLPLLEAFPITFKKIA